jgi:hypothetical protein
VISRKTRREAVEAARAAARPPDPRLEMVEKVMSGVQAAGNVLVAGLCAVAWLWLGSRRTPAAGSTGAIAEVPQASMTGSPFLNPLAAASGTTLTLIMLSACLLLAPVVNPFYAPPAERRHLHLTTTALFGLLVVTTVAVIAGAAR